MLAQATGGSECGYWPTVLEADWRKRGPNSCQQGLPEIAIMWNTPTATPEAPNKNCNQKDKPGSLGRQAQKMWPTPCAQEDNKSPDAYIAMKKQMKGGPRKMVTSLQVMSKMWPTPNQRDTRRGCNQKQLATEVDKWPTPSSEGSAGEIAEELERKGGKLVNRKTGRVLQANLATEVKMWATPAAADCQGSTGGGKTLRKDVKHWFTPKGSRLNPNYAREFSHPGQATSTLGEKSLQKGRSLNPLFVAWLMNWPIGWTSLLWADRTSYESWETASCHWLRRLLSTI